MRRITTGCLRCLGKRLRAAVEGERHSNSEAQHVNIMSRASAHREDDLLITSCISTCEAFIFYILLNSFMMLNMLVGILVEAMSSHRCKFSLGCRYSLMLCLDASVLSLQVALRVRLRCMSAPNRTFYR